MRMCHFRDQNGPFVINNFFWQKPLLLIYINFTLLWLLALFTVQNLKKFLQRIQSYEDAPFLGPKWFICPKQKFDCQKWRTKRQMEGRTDGRTIFYRTLPAEAASPKNKETRSIARKIFISQHRNVENIQHVLETQLHQPEDRKSS